MREEVGPEVGWRPVRPNPWPIPFTPQPLTRWSPCVQNPTFVDKSADIGMAAKRTCWARCMNAGQQCIAPDFVLCHRDVVDEFCEAAKGW